MRNKFLFTTFDVFYPMSKDNGFIWHMKVVLVPSHSARHVHFYYFIYIQEVYRLWRVIVTLHSQL